MREATFGAAGSVASRRRSPDAPQATYTRAPSRAIALAWQSGNVSSCAPPGVFTESPPDTMVYSTGAGSSACAVVAPRARAREIVAQRPTFGERGRRLVIPGLYVQCEPIAAKAAEDPQGAALS